jgi:hypothetical protein
MKRETNTAATGVLVIVSWLTLGHAARADVILQPGPKLDDTYVSANVMWNTDACTTNYGDDWLAAFTYDACDGEVFGPPSRLGWVQESMIRFDLGDLTWADDLEITSATLSINHCDNPFGSHNENYYPRETNTLGLYAIEADWDEYAVTYNTRPEPFTPYAGQTAPWVPGEADPSAYDYCEDGELLTTWSFPDDGDAALLETISDPVGWIDLDVTQYVTDVLLGNRVNHGWTLAMLLNEDQTWNEGFPVFASGDWQPDDDASLSPKLTIYGNVVPEPSSLALVGVATLATLRRRRTLLG